MSVRSYVIISTLAFYLPGIFLLKIKNLIKQLFRERLNRQIKISTFFRRIFFRYILFLLLKLCSKFTFRLLNLVLFVQYLNVDSYAPLDGCRPCLLTHLPLFTPSLSPTSQDINVKVRLSRLERFDLRGLHSEYLYISKYLFMYNVYTYLSI